MALALDRTKTSSRDATCILVAVATSLGYDLGTVRLSHSTVHRSRVKIREKVAERLKANLQVANHLTIHWGGKLFSEPSKIKKVERVPVSGLNTEQLLCMPKFNKGSAENQSIGIAEQIFEWNLQERIKAMCFDTTPLNTGEFLGMNSSSQELFFYLKYLTMSYLHLFLLKVIKVVCAFYWRSV